MSRVGQQPITVPRAVQVELDGNRLKLKGKLGELEHELPEGLEVVFADGGGRLEVTRKSEARGIRAMHGLHRALIANKVQGVAEGFSKRLEIYGTGYNVNLRGNTLVLQVGFCHEVTFDLPEGVTVQIEQNAAQVDRPARFVVRGIDKGVVGQFAAKVRAVRPPEPYKGKGVRYEGEYVRRKEGKAFTGLER